MKKLQHIAIIVVLGLLVSCEKEIDDIGQIRHFSLTSEHTGATYNLSVAMPVDFDEGTTYRTLYLLDGDWYFEHTAREADRISSAQNQTNIIVVGIDGGNGRKTDFTPTSGSQGEGGAANFTRFLQEELIPYIHHRHPVDTSRNGRAIMGHSLGGLYGAYAFTRHNYMFGNYFMLSPSIWYDEAVVLNYEAAFREVNSANSGNVLISHGEIENTQLFIEMFHNRIKEHYPLYQTEYHIVPRKNHQSSASPAITEALHFYFQSE